MSRWEAARTRGFAGCRIFRKAADSQWQNKDTKMPLFTFDTDKPRDNSWHEFRFVRVASDDRPRSRVRRALRIPERIAPEAPRSGASSDSPRHYSRRTEAAYVAWIRRFIVFHRKRHPRELGEWMNDSVRAQRPARLPVVMSRD